MAIGLCVVWKRVVQSTELKLWSATEIRRNKYNVSLGSFETLLIIIIITSYMSTHNKKGEENDYAERISGREDAANMNFSRLNVRKHFFSERIVTSVRELEQSRMQCYRL